LNGLHPQQMQSQTPYGPHLPTSVSAPVVSQVNHASNATQPSSQEEISTIFVVGFPEDMQVGTALSLLGTNSLIKLIALLPFLGARIPEHVYVLSWL
jgi:hypothetical protein